MSITINGISWGIPKDIDSNQSLAELLGYLRKNLCGAESTISSIQLEGRELTEAEEAKFATTPVTQLGDIDVFTSHPHELAQETLQSLLPFLNAMTTLSQSLAEQLRHPKLGVNLDVQYHRLVEGMRDFTEALRGVKQIMRIHNDPEVTLLEVDLSSVLEDLFQAQKNKNLPYFIDLLDQHLPFNLAEWHERGIPKLIRSRDS